MGIEQGLPLQAGQSEALTLMEARDFLFSVFALNSPELNPPFSVRGTMALQQG